MEVICIHCKQLAKVSCSCINLYKTTQKIYAKKGLESFSFSANFTEIQKQLQTTFNLFLQGPSCSVRTLVVTKDDKYIISGSDDNTIRIWNLLENRQESVLQGHSKGVNSLAVTSDNKYIVSGSNDYTVRVWNLLERIQETVFKGQYQ